MRINIGTHEGEWTAAETPRMVETFLRRMAAESTMEGSTLATAAALVLEDAAMSAEVTLTAREGDPCRIG